jgi:hypothetical protein
MPLFESNEMYVYMYTCIYHCDLISEKTFYNYCMCYTFQDIRIHLKR